MFVKLGNSFILLALVLMLFQMTIRAAIILPKKLDNKRQNEEVNQQTAANEHEDVVIPILSTSPEDNPDIPGFPDFPNFPHVHLSQYNNEEANDAPTEGPLRRGDEFKGDRRLPNEESEYYDENPRRGYRERNTSPKPKMYKAVERVYYYPQDDGESGESGESEPSKNRKAMNAMKAYIPENYSPYNENEDTSDGPEILDDYRNRAQNQREMLRNSQRNSQRNPQRNEPQETEDNSDGQESDGTQVSIADDVKEFGKEAVDEANRFEKFLDNLRNFAVDSESEYSTPKDKPNQRHEIQESDDRPDYQDDGLNPSYRDSTRGLSEDDRTKDYERSGQYGSPEDYDAEKTSYQNQRDKTNKGGHRYHKDRRRHKKPISDQAFEQRRHEVTSLIDAEPDEADYLSNSDVVKQLKKSETKYNTGVDPVYSSQRDFDEVKRLEKMIENIALLNKEKEKNAAEAHDQHEISETKVKKVKSNQPNKTKDGKNNKKND